jgi:hypothetical protein
VVAWRGPDALTVHLVNLTNPMMMRGAIRELLPVGPLEVRVQLPEGRRVARVRLLRAETDAETVLEKGVLTVSVPSVADHEVIALDLEA